MGLQMWHYYQQQGDDTITALKEGYIMSDSEKIEFLYLFYSANKDVRDLVLKILKNQEPLDALQDQQNQKG